MAGISIFKLLVILFAAGALLTAMAKGRPVAALRELPVKLTLALLAVLALGIVYSSASSAEALSTFGKYGKLLLIPAIWILIQSREQAVTSLRFYFVTQSFVVICSWLLFFGVPLPWVPAIRSASSVVFSSYLDQAILTAGFAALAWHLRKEFSFRMDQWLPVALCLLAVLNLVFVLQGRSGQVCLIAAIGLAAWQATPPKLRPIALLAPVAAFGVAMAMSAQFNQRYVSVVNEIRVFQAKTDSYKNSSSGERLNYWHKSLQAIAEKPVLGHGTGAWQQQYWRFENGKPSVATAQAKNPHQEYLFWATQLGIGGMLLLILWQGSFAWQARNYPTSEKYAALSLLAVFVVACSFNSALYDGLVGDYFCTLLAVLACLGRYSSSAPSHEHS